MKCEFCNNYLEELKRCKFCSFEFNEKYEFFKSDDWDIMNLKEEDGWEHTQILDRLRLKNIDCYKADIWFDNNMAYLVGCHESSDRIADVLGLHKDVVYNDFENGIILLNLFQEKCIREDENLERFYE